MHFYYKHFSVRFPSTKTDLIVAAAATIMINTFHHDCNNEVRSNYPCLEGLGRNKKGDEESLVFALSFCYFFWI